MNLVQSLPYKEESNAIAFGSSRYNAVTNYKMRDGPFTKRCC